MLDEMSGYFNDDGTPFNPNLISSPSLCATCKKNDSAKYEVLCNLTRADQEEGIFVCFAYRAILGKEETKAVLKEMEEYLNGKDQKQK